MVDLFYIKLDEVTRDYVENVSDNLVRSARLMPWVQQDMKHIDFKNEEPGNEHFEVSCSVLTIN